MVTEFKIDWPAKKKYDCPKSKLDKHFLCSTPLPPAGALFFPDLHTEVSRLWGKPFSACNFSPDCKFTNLLEDLDEGEEVRSNDIKELHWTADLTLWATKETARAIDRFMAAICG